MSRTAVLRLAVVLILMFGFGLSSTAAAADGSHIGFMWPVGLASGAMLLTPRHLTRYAASAVAVLAGLSFALGGYPVGVGVGYGIGIAVEAVIAQQVLTESWHRRLRLRDAGDLARFAIACALGAGAAALVFTAVSALASFGTPWKVGLSVLVTHTVGQAVLLGLFRESAHQVASYSRRRRLVAWILTIAVTVGAFIPTEVPSLAFLVIPLLGWVAFRARMIEAMLQLVVVASISSTMTSRGLGPFSDPVLLDRLDPEFAHLPLQAFLLACSMVTIPFSMAVGMQRRSAAEVLIERGRSDQLVQSTHGIAIMGTDSEGRINLFNPGAQRILGYTPEEVRGRTTAMFHTDAEIARLTRSLGTVPTYEGLVEGMRDLAPGPARDLEFIRKDGVPRTLSTIISPIHDEHGAMVGYVATADDVTDRTNTQAALEAALESEREAVERLTQIDQVKDRFVSSVSHELRTPITNIVGYLELLMDGVYGDPSQEQTRAMTRIDMNSRRLLTLIDDLLTLSSMESLDQPRRLAPVDLVTVVRHAEEIVRPGLMRRDLDLDVKVPDHPVVIPGDAGQLERVVINLATNAVKFTLDGGRVTLRLIASANGSAGPVIEVEDTGIGIPDADQEMLFSRFFRAAQARETAVPGSGLGLSIAKSIVELHGGEISARSVYGSGSTFRVEFPAEAASPS
jgi:PAS domain S-box-containing protein